jgi:O-antigen ligase
LISLYQLSARAGFLAAIIVFPLYFLIKLYNRYSRWAVLTIIIIMALLFTFLAVKNSRVSNLISTVSDQKIEDGIRKDPRLLIWQSAFGVIKDNPILGVGTGDASSKLKEEFALRGYLEGYYDNLNAHNQFLEIWLENGIIGLILFLCILGYIIHLAIKQKNILLGMFIITTIIFFIFETMMNRLAGISFFALFSFLFIYSKSPTVQK